MYIYKDAADYILYIINCIFYKCFFYLFFLLVNLITITVFFQWSTKRKEKASTVKWRYAASGKQYELYTMPNGQTYNLLWYKCT